MDNFPDNHFTPDKEIERRADEKMHIGISQLVNDYPYIGQLGLRLILKPVWEPVSGQVIPTCAVNGVDLYFNPRFIDGQSSMGKVRFILAHEILHCALNHHARMGTRMPFPWNGACDFAINPLLREGQGLINGRPRCSLEWPGDGLDDPKLRDDKGRPLAAEIIYERLMSGAAKMPMFGGQGQGEGEGEGESKPGDVGGTGIVLAPPTNVPEASEEEWQIASQQAAMGAKMMGDGSNPMVKTFLKLSESKIPWEDQLAEFMCTPDRSDYRRNPPSRRYVPFGVYMPSMRGESLGFGVIIIDTSGSVCQKELDQFAGETSAILEGLNPSRIVVLYVDTSVAGVEEFTAEDLPLEMTARGRGGTDFRPGFEWIAEQDEAPEWILYFTDMECRRFPEDPGIPTLWVSTTGADWQPPFGQLIAVEV